MYDEKDFELRFRDPRVVFSRINSAIKTEPWRQQQPNATGRPQAYALQKLIGAFHIIAYEVCMDLGEEYFALIKTTIFFATNRLVAFFLRTYQNE